MVTITSMKTMGNQQVTSNNWAWLAGIWDGEGTFAIYRSSRNNRTLKQSTSVLTGRLTLSNTSETMIAEISRILTSAGIGMNIWRNPKPRKFNHKKEIHLTINCQKDVIAICEKLIPYLVVKKDRASILLEFLRIRSGYKRKVGRDPKTGRITGVLTQGYDEDLVRLFEKMKVLNQVGVIDGTSETTR